MDLKSKRVLTLEELENQGGQLLSSSPTQADSARHFLPVLYINDKTQWKSVPMEQRKHFTDEVAQETCLSNCCGVKGLKAGCCHLDPENLEHVLGPVDEDWIKSTLKWLNSKKIWFKRSDLVIDLEEGKIIGATFFNDHPVFNSPQSYPILRFQVTGPRFACKFLSEDTGRCTIYEHRPDMCRDFYCEFIQGSFLVRTREHPNRYVKLR